MWNQIAEHYKNYGENLIFELLNEPNNNLTDSLWNKYIIEGISNYREIDSNRTLIVGPSNWNSINSLEKLNLSKDNNLIVTIHFYSSFQFIHQEAKWVGGSNKWIETTWSGSNQEISEIESDFINIKNWSNSNNLPIFLGEFCAYNKAGFVSRYLWTEKIVNKSMKYDFSWGYWEFCSGFGLWNQNTREWNQLLKALLN